jgi:hypothetical protein
MAVLPRHDRRRNTVRGESGVLFESPPIRLSKLLEDVGDGKIQLPDFQRPWKWDDDRIISLLATVTLGYPMGVMMTVQTGGPGAMFKPRPLDGAEVPTGAKPEALLMDGQQRLTSLFRALCSASPVETMDSRGKKLRRWYYLDIEGTLNRDRDREDAILSIPENRQATIPGSQRVTRDLSTPEAEYAAGLFPLRLVFDAEAINDWQHGYVRVDDSRWGTWGAFSSKVLNNVTGYELPVIRLAKETPKEAVCTVFENVNTKGLELNVFELLTATYAIEDFQLPEHWQHVKEELAACDIVGGVGEIPGIADTDFLRAVCLVSTNCQRKGRPGVDPFTQPGASCKRADILNLPLAEYTRWEETIVTALTWTERFLNRQGIFHPYDLPYRSQIPALAAIRTVLGDEADTPDAEAKITRWYWCGVLGEQYSGSLDSRLPRDLEQVVAWVRGGKEPTSVTEASFHAARLDTMCTRNSAAYKGVWGLLLKKECVDWTYTREPINAKISADQQVDVALIFPKAWCVKKNIPPERTVGIVNKTLLTSRTRRIIANHGPEVYMSLLEAEAGLPGNWLDDIVATHLVEAKHLRAADFDAFYASRSAMLLELIEAAMGKPAVAADAAPESAADYLEEQSA